MPVVAGGPDAVDREGDGMTGIWPYLAAAAALTLAVVLAHGFAGLFADMRRAERDLAAERRLLDRYGGSVAWNDETPAELGGHRGSAPTPRGRNGR